MADVAFVLPDFRCGGAEKVALHVIESLVARGCDVDLVLFKQRGALLDSLPSTVRVFDLGAKRVRNAILPLVRYLKRERPKAVEASMWPVTVATIAAHRLARSESALAVSDHGILSRQYDGPLERALVRATTRLFYPLADTRIAVSRGVADDLSGLSGLARDRFTLLHNPLQLPSKVASTREVEALWDGAQLRILTVGQMKAVKNQALLIRALGRLPAGVDSRLIIAGNGDLHSDLVQLARSEGVANRVHFAGLVADPTPFYASANVFALTSSHEALPNVLVEALNAGLPIVSTATSGAREILCEGEFGRLLDAPTPSVLAEALLDAAMSNPVKSRLRARSRELAGDESLRRYEALLCKCGN